VLANSIAVMIPQSVRLVVYSRYQWVARCRSSARVVPPSRSVSSFHRQLWKDATGPFFQGKSGTPWSNQPLSEIALTINSGPMSLWVCASTCYKSETGRFPSPLPYSGLPPSPGILGILVDERRPLKGRPSLVRTCVESHVQT
jgi:hypothetical protein